MLNLLKIKVSGFKLLEDNFCIDLTTKARVNEHDKEKEVVYIDKGLHVFRSYAFVGANSSGKTTVLSLILKTLLLLQTGRWENKTSDFKNDKIYLDVLFYLDKNLYNYKVVLKKTNDNNLPGKNICYSSIIDEKLIILNYNKARGSKNIDLIDSIGENRSDLLQASLNDTSYITKITNNKVLVDEFCNNNVSNFDGGIYRTNTFFNSLNACNNNLVSSIIKLLDDSIEYIKYNEEMQTVKFKRFNDKEMIMSTIDFLHIVSAGTFRGVELYIRSINAIKYGKVFIVDEIENCFQKNLVYNLIFLFNDSTINKNNAQIYFSTHYVEILDYINRRDGIFITHKDNSQINIKNLYSDYDVRTELLKSKQFDNNVFNTSINYKQLLEVRRALINDLQINND